MWHENSEESEQAMHLREVLDYVDTAGLQIALNAAGNGLLCWPVDHVSVDAARVLRIHKQLLLAWLTRLRNDQLMQQVVHEIRNQLDYCACGQLGTFRALDGVWYCAVHEQAYADALWPPVDSTWSAAECARLTAEMETQADVEARHGQLLLSVSDAPAAVQGGTRR